MAGNKLKKRSNGDIVETMAISKRRKVVADLRTRGMTADEIVEHLPALGIVNEERDGQPYKRMTVYRDLHAIEKQWRREASRTIGRHKARVLAELQAVKTEAWSSGKLMVVLKALGQEAKMLGLNAPDLVAITDNHGNSLSPEQARSTLDQLTQMMLGAIPEDTDDDEVRRLRLMHDQNTIDGAVAAT